MKKITFFLIFTCIFSENWDINEIQYLIFTKSSFSEAAQQLSFLHETEVENSDKLKTKIILEDTLGVPLNEFIFNTFSQINNEFENLKYLAIIGDESIIEPIYYLGTPCDDCFSSQNINNPNPTLITGRILSSNQQQAITIINNIKNYMLNPQSGDWKSEMLLFCDDQFKNGETIRREKWHTLHSNVIYNSLKNNMNINCMYGPMFERQQSVDWYTQPEFTNALIQYINKGLGIINYIGHGTSEFLADEDILTYSNVDLISIENNKLPIWVVGTCSFGDYINQNCLAEKLLTKGDAAIAVISTTGGVSYAANFYYLKNFFTENLFEVLNNNEDDYRIGDLFYNSKGNLFTAYTFHLFGDPAMKIQLSTINDNLISNDIEAINIGVENTLNINNSELSTLRILNNDQNMLFTYDYNGENFSPNDSCFNSSYNYSCIDEFEFSYNGVNLYNGEFYNTINYILPIDAYQYDSAILKIQNDQNNTIQILDNTNLEVIEGEILDDVSGPEIIILQNNAMINNNSKIYPPYNFKIELNDEIPINISGLNFHDIRFWIDNNEAESIILNNFFIPTSETSGYINFTLSEQYITKINHTINIEAWDILNNPNQQSYDVEFSNYNDIIYNVYNFPNPFVNKTFFTFGFANSESITAKIIVYALNGEKIYNTTEYLEHNNNHFYQIEWDGEDNNGIKIPNGLYLYHLEVIKNNSIIHKGIYKIIKSQ